MGIWGSHTNPPDTHGYPGDVGVVFSNDPGQLRIGSVCVRMGPARTKNQIYRAYLVTIHEYFFLDVVLSHLYKHMKS